MKLRMLCFLLLAAAATAQEYSLNQFLNIQRALQPSFSPAGTEVSYLTNISGVNQVWRQDMYSGQFGQLTFEPDGADGAWWCPTNPLLMVLAASRGGNERSQLYLFNPNGSAWYRVTKDDNAIYAFGGWSQDGTRFAFASNERNKTDFDIYEHRVDQSEPVLLFEATGYNRVAGYSADGSKLLVQRYYSNFHSDVYVYDFAAGEVALVTSYAEDAIHDSPCWDGTNTGIYLLSDRGRNYQGLAHIDLSASAFTWVETPEQDIELLAVAPNGSTMAWIENASGYSKFHFRNIEKDTYVGSYRFPNGVIRSLNYSPTGDKLAAVFGTPTRPYDVWIYDTAGEKLRELTYSATGGLPVALFREPQLITYKTFDDREIPAFWYTPAESKGKMPVIVYIHGGPESQARADMNGLIQYFLYHGYAVLEPNVRGSSGFGRDYLELDNVEKRMDSVTDIEYAARWLKARKDVDKEQLIVMGGSYGGFMVLSNLVTYPDLWAAGVSIVGISNFVTFLENTGSYRRALREAEYGSLETDREFLESISPLNHVENIKAPLMLIQGANDPRVPQSESDQIATALRERGGVVEYLLFEDEGHGLRKTENRIEAYSAVVEFLNKYVRDK